MNNLKAFRKALIRSPDKVKGIPSPKARISWAEVEALTRAADYVLGLEGKRRKNICGDPRALGRGRDVMHNIGHQFYLRYIQRQEDAGKDS